MKEFRGTPGEWTYEPSNPYDGVECYWLNADGYQIGSVDGPLDAEREANARLMAASKDLLEALQGMLEQFTKTPSSLKDSEARIKAHAAIKKALGE